VVDQDLPHRPRGQCEEEITIRRPVEDLLVQRPDDRHVDHRRGREGVVGPLLAHQASGHLAQLIIDQCDELTPGPVVTSPGLPQDECQVTQRLGLHHLFLKRIMKGYCDIFRGTH
jgi:hypothetical protein